MSIKKSLWVFVTGFVMVLGTACGSTPTSPQDDPSESPTEQVYPAPGQGSEVIEIQPISTQPPVSSDEPYPAPDNPIPPELMKFLNLSVDAGQLGNVFIDSSEILILESYPVQVKLLLTGNLPTPCHRLETKVLPPDEENRIQVVVYSLTSPDVICIQVLEPFEIDIPLGDFTEGKFTVWVNGEAFGEFKLP